MGPLEGISVLDLSTMVSGPVAAMMLADQGADVIKVEPIHGEQMRHLGMPHNGVNAMFFSCNRGKRSLSLDLKAAAGKKILWQLIESADVLIQNFRPGAIDRMGFPAEEALRVNPRLIYVSISGFGENGPYAHQRVYDPVIQALSGATDIQRDRTTDRPQMFRIIVADKVTSVTAAQAVSSALFAREKTGKGQHIKLSMLDTMVAFFWPEGMSAITYAERESDPSASGGSMDLIYQTRDGFITAGAVSDAEWTGMCQALEREDLITDERFSTAVARFQHGEDRKRITGEEIARWSSTEILARLDAHDVPSAPLLKRSELMSHEQLRVNHTIIEADYDGFGEVRQARPAAVFEGTPTEIQGPGPRLGEHAEAILEQLGYDQDAIAALRTRGILPP